MTRSTAVATADAEVVKRLRRHVAACKESPFSKETHILLWLHVAEALDARAALDEPERPRLPSPEEVVLTAVAKTGGARTGLDDPSGRTSSSWLRCDVAIDVLRADRAAIAELVRKEFVDVVLAWRRDADGMWVQRERVDAACDRLIAALEGRE